MASCREARSPALCAAGTVSHGNTEMGHVASGITLSLPANEMEVFQQLSSEPSFLRDNSEMAIDAKVADYVRTEDFDDALEVLQDKGVVILCGVPGSGKTTLGHALLRRLRDEEGSVPYILTSIQEWNTYIGGGKKSVVLIDNLFGRATFNKAQHDHWRQILSNVLTLRGQGYCRVIVTIYPHILRKLQDLESTTESILKDQQALVQISRKVSEDTKRKLLAFHLRKLNLEDALRRDKMDRILQVDASGPVFPWCCQYMVHNWYSSKEPTVIFTMPEVAYVGLLQEMLDSEHGTIFAAVMALTMLGETNFLQEPEKVQSKLCRLGFESISGDRLAESVHFLKGFVLAESGKEFYSRVLYDAVGLAFGRSHRLPMIIHICDSRFFAHKICIKQVATAFSVPVNMDIDLIEEALIARMYFEIVKGNLPEVCQNPSLQCVEFLSGLQKFCDRGKSFSGYKFNVKCPSMQQLLRAVDPDHKLSLLYWSIFSPSAELTLWCLTAAKKLQILQTVPLVMLATSLLNHWSGSEREELLDRFKEVYMTHRYEGVFPENTIVMPLPTGTHLIRDEITSAGKLQRLYCMHNQSVTVPENIASVSLRDNRIHLRVCDRKQWYLIYRLLTDEHPDAVDENCNTLSHLSAIAGNMDIIAFAKKNIGAKIDLKNKENLTPFQLAALRNKTLGHLRDINPYIACQKGDVEAVFWYFALQKTTTRELDKVLLEACKTGCTRIVVLLITFGADVSIRDKTGRTLLLIACSKNHIDTAELLVDIYAREHACLIDETDNEGKTALWIATKNGQIKLVKLLLHHGALTCKADTANGFTPLHVASSWDFFEIIELLLQYGASVNEVDPLGENSLHKAYLNSCKSSTTKLLRDFGAETDTRNNLGETPIDFAIMSQKLSPREKLENAVQKISNSVDGNGVLFPGDLQAGTLASVHSIWKRVYDPQLAIATTGPSSCMTPNYPSSTPVADEEKPCQWSQEAQQLFDVRTEVLPNVGEDLPWQGETSAEREATDSSTSCNLTQTEAGPEISVCSDVKSVSDMLKMHPTMLIARAGCNITTTKFAGNQDRIYETENWSGLGRYSDLLRENDFRLERARFLLHGCYRMDDFQTLYPRAQIGSRMHIHVVDSDLFLRQTFKTMMSERECTSTNEPLVQANARAQRENIYWRDPHTDIPGCNYSSAFKGCTVAYTSANLYELFQDGRFAIDFTEIHFGYYFYLAVFVVLLYNWLKASL